jgi:hypothetical protein
VAKQINQQFRKFNSRFRFAWLAGTGLAVASFFLVHDRVAELLLKEFGAPDRVGDSILVAIILLVFMGVQRLLSLVFYHDTNFGFDALLKETRPVCPTNTMCTRVVIPELREIPRFTKVLAEHLNSVTKQTEAAAVDVVTRLQSVAKQRFIDYSSVTTRRQSCSTISRLVCAWAWASG